MGKREIKLIALDLDGTTLTSEKIMTERTKKAIAGAVSRGVEVVIASGRSRNGVIPLINGLRGINYMIASNGASAIELATGRLIYAAYIDPDRAADILEKLLSIGVMADIYYSGGALSDLRNYKRVTEEKNGFSPWFVEYFIRNRKPVMNLPGLLRERKVPDVEKVTASFDDMQLRSRAFDLMQGESGLSIVAGSSFNMEISQENAIKGKALTALAAALDIDMRSVMAIGDTENDASMIEAAGLGVVMGNADAKIRALADVVTATNDEDGAALAIEQFALQ